MKEYLKGVKIWMLILFLIGLGAAMSWGVIIIISLISKGYLGCALIFIAYPFLIPLFKIAGQTIFREEDKSKRSIWVDISPVTLNGARCVATSAKPVHPPKPVPPPK